MVDFGGFIPVTTVYLAAGACGSKAQQTQQVEVAAG